MQARVKPDSRWSVITACSGCEFLKAEWRDVPAGMEAEAERNPFLEVRELDAIVVEVEATTGELVQVPSDNFGKGQLELEADQLVPQEGDELDEGDEPAKSGPARKRGKGKSQ